MHFVSTIVWLLSEGCTLRSSLRNEHHRDVEDEDNYCHNAVRNDSTARDVCVAHWSRLQEPEAAVDDTRQDNNAAKPLMENAQCASATRFVVV